MVPLQRLLTRATNTKMVQQTGPPTCASAAFTILSTTTIRSVNAGGGVYVGATQDELPTTNFPTPSPGHHMT
jgi:hypothetical protein